MRPGISCDAGPLLLSPNNQKGVSMPAVKDKTSRLSKAVAQSDSFRKLSFGTLTKKREDARTTYPVLPDPNGQLAIIATRIIECAAQLDALDGALSIDKQELKTLATPFYFGQASGKVDPATNVNVLCSVGEVLISFPNRYGRLDSETVLLPILGEQTAKFFRQAFTLEIDGDKLPLKAPKTCSTSSSSCLRSITPPTR
jgi:hypothetical protein